MSLRAFHLLFIAISVVLTAFMAAWAVAQYRAVHETGYVVVCAASIVSGIGLSMYAAKFQRKTRRLV